MKQAQFISLLDSSMDTVTLFFALQNLWFTISNALDLWNTHKFYINFYVNGYRWFCNSYTDTKVKTLKATFRLVYWHKVVEQKISNLMYIIFLSIFCEIWQCSKIGLKLVMDFSPPGSKMETTLAMLRQLGTAPLIMQQFTVSTGMLRLC